MKTIVERLLRLLEVLERVPLGKTTLYHLMREGSFHSDHYTSEIPNEAITNPSDALSTLS